ncbi:hypothetical protein [Streptomyces parvulus]|uniref:hypothetical protein n=1 Tax=Streptomyces parvulus TaxID=146923 RepID=UPI0033B360CB
MAVSLNLIGQTFDRLTVIAPAGHDRQGRRLWRCTCSCGAQEAVTTTDNLRRGRTRSCGCLAREGKANRVRTHGQHSTPLYETWCNIIRRTTNPKHTSYANYGGRGITVCPEWRESFEAFARDVGPTYQAGLSIDRIDVNGHYEPGNVRWATPTEQARNMRRNRLVTAFGQTKTIAEWAELHQLNYQTLFNRLTRSGWPAERALTTPPPNDRRRSAR